MQHAWNDMKLLVHRCGECGREVTRPVYCWNHKREECRECLVKLHLSKLSTFKEEKRA